MSLLRAIAAHIQDNGSATLDELTSAFPEYTRKRLWSAMKNAKWEGLIHCHGRVPHQGGRARGSVGARYYPGKKATGLPTPAPATPSPPASVWELGTKQPRAWPPAGTGRRFSPLGGWTE